MGQRIKITVGLTSAVNSYKTHYEGLPEDWDEMSEEQRSDYLNEAYQDAVNNVLDGAAEVVDN